MMMTQTQKLEPDSPNRGIRDNDSKESGGDLGSAPPLDPSGCRSIIVLLWCPPHSVKRVFGLGALEASITYQRPSAGLGKGKQAHGQAAKSGNRDRDHIGC